MSRIVDLAHRTAGPALLAMFLVAPASLASQAAPGNGSRVESPDGRAYAALRSKPAGTASRLAGAPASIAIEGGARRMLVGATVPHVARVRDAAGVERRDVPVRWTSSDPNVASVNQFGVMTAVRPGPVVIRATTGSLSAERRYTVESNPVKSLTLSITADQVRTGDVVEVSAVAFDANGYKVPSVPFLYTFTATVEDSAIGQLAPAELDQKGRFVAQKAGDYQIIAVAPGLVAHRTVRVANRDIGAAARVAGHVPPPGSQVADLAGWHGRDGRDYVLACGGGSRAQVMAYEVSDAGLQPLDTIGIDAKSVTECVVDAETGLAALVAESASGRSAIALFDASDPRALRALGTFTDGLGALAGVALDRGRLFAVSDARRLDVVNVEDPARPRRLGSIELGDDRGAVSAQPTDVSVSDGVAYVALGRLGLAIVDVGNGKFGGSAAKPVRVAGFRAPFTSMHAAYGYRSRTGKWYVITSEDLTAPDAADLRGGRGSAWQPGFARIIDVTDPARPEDVARYEVPEAGVQDLWVEGERLYVAAQNGGVRVVDISADLKGNLYHQGREVMRFSPGDGSTAPNVVAAQPLHGSVLAADRTTGVWMVRLAAREQP